MPMVFAREGRLGIEQLPGWVLVTDDHRRFELDPRRQEFWPDRFTDLCTAQGFEPADVWCHDLGARGRFWTAVGVRYPPLPRSLVTGYEDTLDPLQMPRYEQADETAIGKAHAIRSGLLQALCGFQVDPLGASLQPFPPPRGNVCRDCSGPG